MDGDPLAPSLLATVQGREASMRTKFFTVLAVFAAVIASVVFASTAVLAHCDGMDGPVAQAAQKALETGDVNLVLIWVLKDDEEK
jgi:hypothetical protein